VIVHLLTIVHDQDGALLPAMKAYLQRASSIYNKMYIVISDETNDAVEAEARKNGLKTFRIPKKGAAFARRQALRLVFENFEEAATYHYCDFDRLLTWLEVGTAELKHTIETCPDVDYLLLGRTKQAFQSHPLEWQETEKWTNHLFSLAIGFEADVTAGSCIMSSRALKAIVAELPYSIGKMTDAEWPLLVKNKVKEAVIQAEFVNGLCYRERNRALEEDSVINWANRIKLSSFIAETILTHYYQGTSN